MRIETQSIPRTVAITTTTRDQRPEGTVKTTSELRQERTTDETGETRKLITTPVNVAPLHQQQSSPQGSKNAPVRPHQPGPSTAPVPMDVTIGNMPDLELPQASHQNASRDPGTRVSSETLPLIAPTVLNAPVVDPGKIAPPTVELVVQSAPLPGNTGGGNREIATIVTGKIGDPNGIVDTIDRGCCTTDDILDCFKCICCLCYGLGKGLEVLCEAGCGDCCDCGDCGDCGDC